MQKKKNDAGFKIITIKFNYILVPEIIGNHKGITF